VKCIFALILVLIIFKHPKYRIRKNCVDMCAREGRRQWHAGEENRATTLDIQGRGASKELNHKKNHKN